MGKKGVFDTINSSKYWKEFKGNQFKKSSYTFIYFWSVSCGYCKEMLNSLQSFYEEVKEHTEVISVHVPLSENDLELLRIQEVINQYQIVSPIILDHNHDLFALFKSRFLPALYLINSEEEIVKKKIGYEGIQEWLLELRTTLDVN